MSVSLHGVCETLVKMKNRGKFPRSIRGVVLETHGKNRQCIIMFLCYFRTVDLLRI